MATYNFIQSVGRAFAILEQFSPNEREIGVTALAARVGLHKSTCFGLLHTLQNLGYIQQNPDNGRYSLGIKSFELGQRYIQGQDLRAIAAPYLRQLMESTQETVHLVLLEGARAIYIDKVEGPHSMTISSRVGKEARMHCSGVGKILLAYLPDSMYKVAIDKLEMSRNTDRTITDKRLLIEHLRLIREQGYAVDDEEIEIGLCCIAAPIFNSKNQVIAAISISGPNARLMRERFSSFIEQAKNCARTISHLLGNNIQKS